MGPLFSIAIVFVGALALSLGAFLFARLFRIPRPFLVALVFPAGSVLGGAVSVLIGAAVIGAGATLTSTSQIFGYCAFLGVGSFSVGVLAVWCCKRALTFTPSGRATRAGQ